MKILKIIIAVIGFLLLTFFYIWVIGFIPNPGGDSKYNEISIPYQFMRIILFFAVYAGGWGLGYLYLKYITKKLLKL